jgi:nucleotide-binding universal stress UspA family protein
MFDTILVGVDGAEGGRDALALARTFQRTFRSLVVAVTAYPAYTFPSRTTSRRSNTVLARDTEALLRDEVWHAGVHARTRAIPDGSPARALHAAAEAEGADLIIVGADDQDLLGRALAGNVTSGTLHGSPCAVAVAPRGLAARAHELRRIGVGQNDFLESTHALALARAIADAADASLEVIAVAPPLDPWVELVKRSAVLDLLLVGSRDYGPVRRLLLGSTSRRLVLSAVCPVVVLPRGAHTESATEPAVAGAATSWRIRPDQLP